MPLKMTVDSTGSIDMNDALAAAVTAAAELAKNGGGIYLNNLDTDFHAPKELVPVMISSKNQDDASLMDEDSEEEEDESQDTEKRVCKSRARNREHARRTRIRKKAQLEKLQDKVKGLQEERQVLKQSIEEYSIASILTGLGRSGAPDNTVQTLLQEASHAEETENILPLGKRNRFVSVDMTEKQPPRPLQIKIGGQTAFIGGGRTHINWKTGIYSDDHGAQKQLSNKQLETLRRERNRMHAKMTRDRKKNFMVQIEKTIHDLEGTNQRMKQVLAKVTHTHCKSSRAMSSPKGVTPVSSPESSSVISHEEIPPLDGIPEAEESASKRVRHGFTLIS